MLVPGATSPLCKYVCFAAYARQKKRAVAVVVGGVNGGIHGDDENTNIGFGRRIRPWCFMRKVISSSNSWASIGLLTAAAATIMFSAMGITNAAVELPSQKQQQQRQQLPESTLSDIPQMLSGECSAASAQECKKARIQRPKSSKAESCTSKCVTTCIQGGDGSPGEGPLNLRRPLVVFKQGFRSRRYCAVLDNNSRWWLCKAKKCEDPMRSWLKQSLKSIRRIYITDSSYTYHLPTQNVINFI